MEQNDKRIMIVRLLHTLARELKKKGQCLAGQGQGGWEHHCSQEDPAGAGGGGHSQHSHPGDLSAQRAAAAECRQVCITCKWLQIYS